MRISKKGLERNKSKEQVARQTTKHIKSNSRLNLSPMKSSKQILSQKKIKTEQSVDIQDLELMNVQSKQVVIQSNNQHFREISAFKEKQLQKERFEFDHPIFNLKPNDSYEIDKANSKSRKFSKIVNKQGNQKDRKLSKQVYRLDQKEPKIMIDKYSDYDSQDHGPQENSESSSHSLNSDEQLEEYDSDDEQQDKLSVQNENQLNVRELLTGNSHQNLKSILQDHRKNSSMNSSANIQDLDNIQNKEEKVKHLLKQLNKGQRLNQSINRSSNIRKSEVRKQATQSHSNTNVTKLCQLLCEEADVQDSQDINNIMSDSQSSSDSQSNYQSNMNKNKSIFKKNSDIQGNDFIKKIKKNKKDKNVTCKFIKIIKQDNPQRVRWDLFVMVLSIWNGCAIPLDIAYEPEIFSTKLSLNINLFMDMLFVLDMVFNFFTSYIDSTNGEEILNPKRIACHYLSSFQFYIDIISAVSWDLALEQFIAVEYSEKLPILQMLKLFRLLRLSRIINYMNESEDVKHSLRLFKLFLFLILYIHCMSCLIFFIAKQDSKWIPGQLMYYDNQESFYQLDNQEQYLISFYNSMLALTGNEIFPHGKIQFILSSFLLLSGALINANLFGTIAVIAQTFNRKAQRFQDQIDVANTSMKNMKLPTDLQTNVREFMMTTHSNLDNQQELDQFLNMISPSLRLLVTQHIFLNAITNDSIFSGNNELIEFLVKDATTLLFLPEDQIIQQGSKGETLYFIAKGDCDIWIKDHLKKNRFIRQIFQGEYFGELALITQQQRTATVKSSNYCTMASINQTVFYEMCNIFPEIFTKIKRNAMKYNDPWKRFQSKLLDQINYFQCQIDKEQFIQDVQYHLQDDYYEKGCELISYGETCSAIMFIVSGKIDLYIDNADGERVLLERLKPGDVIGQYSVLFNQQMIFTAIAQTKVRLLSIDQQFFIEERDSIEGLEDAVCDAELQVEKWGIPIFDVKTFHIERPKPIKRFKKAVRRLLILNQMESKSRHKFKNLIQMMKNQKLKDIEEISQENSSESDCFQSNQSSELPQPSTFIDPNVENLSKNQSKFTYPQKAIGPNDQIQMHNDIKQRHSRSNSNIYYLNQLPLQQNQQQINGTSLSQKNHGSYSGYSNSNYNNQSVQKQSTSSFYNQFAQKRKKSGTMQNLKRVNIQGGLLIDKSKIADSCQRRKSAMVGNHLFVKRPKQSIQNLSPQDSMQNSSIINTFSKQKLAIALNACQRTPNMRKKSTFLPAIVPLKLNQLNYNGQQNEIKKMNIYGDGDMLQIDNQDDEYNKSIAMRRQLNSNQGNFIYSDRNKKERKLSDNIHHIHQWKQNIKLNIHNRKQSWCQDQNKSKLQQTTLHIEENLPEQRIVRDKKQYKSQNIDTENINEFMHQSLKIQGENNDQVELPKPKLKETSNSKSRRKEIDLCIDSFSSSRLRSSKNNMRQIDIQTQGISPSPQFFSQNHQQSRSIQYFNKTDQHYEIDESSDLQATKKLQINPIVREESRNGSSNKLMNLSFKNSKSSRQFNSTSAAKIQEQNNQQNSDQVLQYSNEEESINYKQRNNSDAKKVLSGKRRRSKNISPYLRNQLNKQQGSHSQSEQSEQTSLSKSSISNFQQLPSSQCFPPKSALKTQKTVHFDNMEELERQQRRSRKDLELKGCSKSYSKPINNQVATSDLQVSFMMQQPHETPQNHSNGIVQYDKNLKQRGEDIYLNQDNNERSDYLMYSFQQKDQLTDIQQQAVQDYCQDIDQQQMRDFEQFFELEYLQSQERNKEDYKEEDSEEDELQDFKRIKTVDVNLNSIHNKNYPRQIKGKMYSNMLLEDPNIREGDFGRQTTHQKVYKHQSFAMSPGQQNCNQTNSKLLGNLLSSHTPTKGGNNNQLEVLTPYRLNRDSIAKRSINNSHQNSSLLSKSPSALQNHSRAKLMRKKSVRKLQENLQNVNDNQFQMNQWQQFSHNANDNVVLDSGNQFKNKLFQKRVKMNQEQQVIPRNVTSRVTQSSAYPNNQNFCIFNPQERLQQLKNGIKPSVNYDKKYQIDQYQQQLQSQSQQQFLGNQDMQFQNQVQDFDNLVCPIDQDQNNGQIILKSIFHKDFALSYPKRPANQRNKTIKDLAKRKLAKFTCK